MRGAGTLAIISRGTLHKFGTWSIAIVWVANGLFCKVLNMVPRHEQIVARILGGEYSLILTKAIGFSEIVMAIWVLSGFRSRWCTSLQVFIVLIMNIIEFLLAPDLLQWGRFNLLFALLFIGFVWANEVVFKRRIESEY